MPPSWRFCAEERREKTFLASSFPPTGAPETIHSEPRYSIFSTLKRKGTESPVTVEAGRKCSGSLGACEWSDGLVKGSVYDFITWHADGHCGACKPSQNYKRITVVVTVKVPGGNHETPPLRVSTLMVEPS